jgi:hypothetical protein
MCKAVDIANDCHYYVILALIVMRSDNYFPLAVETASMVNVYNPKYDLLVEK